MRSNVHRVAMGRRIWTAAMAIIFSAGTLCLWTYSSLVQAGVSNMSSTGIQSLASGRDSSCAISAGKIYCWGRNNSGQLGNNGSADSSTPVSVYTAGVLAGKNATFIDGGNLRTYCVIADGSVYCWGSNGFGQFGNNTTGTTSNVPVATTMSGTLSGKAVSKVSVGDGHVCAIASGAGYCWGANAQGRLGDGTTSTRLTPVAVRANSGDALFGKTVTDIGAGSAYSCAVASGAVYCWGDNSVGQLGSGTAGTPASSSVPVAVDTSASSSLNGKTITKVVAGTSSNCALATDSTVHCWGVGVNGELGNGASTNSAYAVQVTGAIAGKTIVDISMGGSRMCAIDNTGLAYCWGNGYLGNNASGGSNTSVAVYTGGLLSGKVLKLISAGESSNNACVATSDSVYCWGVNTYGQIGDNSTTTRLQAVYVKFTTAFTSSSYRLYQNANSLTPGTPLAATNTSATLAAAGDAFRVRGGVKNLPRIEQVSSGEHSCALATGKAYCWGKNTNGQLGNASTTDSNIPVAVNTAGVLAGKTITSLNVGADFTCAIASGGLYCWGLNTNGQLGNASNTSSNVPVAVDTSGVLSGKTAMAIRTGRAHTCAIASGAVYCWGKNTNGQLGNASTTDSNIPVAVNTAGVLAGKSAQSLGAGEDFSCALASDQSYCWGDNGQGQLGNASNTSATTPVAVDTSGVLAGKTLYRLSSQSYGGHVCAIASDNLAYCWGKGTYGELGQGAYANSNVPVATDMSGVLSGKTIVSISSGSNQTCVVASDNLAYCWGAGFNGELGNGATFMTSNIPVAVSTSGVLAGVQLRSISARGSSCAISTDNQLYCWGFGLSGQLGNGASSNSSVPVTVSLDGNVAGTTIFASDNTFVLQYAQKSAGTCVAQSSGFADVTGSTAIAYNDNPGVTDGATISSTANDPTASGSTNYQTYKDAAGTFTNTTDIAGGNTGLWDFSLKDNAAPVNTTYCLRIAYSGVGGLERAAYLPEVTTAPGVLSVEFVNSGGVTISTPTFTFGGITASSLTCQLATATYGTSSQKMRIFNSLSPTGWSVSIAATGGATANWNRSDNLAKYDFNDAGSSGCSDSGDSDSFAGQLAVNPSVQTVTPQSGCSTTGISNGSNASFSEGTTNSISLLTASGSTPTNCYWDVTGTALSQKIPAAQLAGSYSVDMTVTAVAL